MITEQMHTSSGVVKFRQNTFFGDLQPEPTATDPLTGEGVKNTLRKIRMQEFSFTEINRNSKSWRQHAFPIQELVTYLL